MNRLARIIACSLLAFVWPLMAADLKPEDPASAAPVKSERPFVIREAAMQRVQSEESRWRANLPRQSGAPRLFFNAEEWRALAVRAASPAETRFFDEVLAQAEETKPAPAYRSPENSTTKRPIPIQAQEELWQRPVGDNLVLLALAAVLRPDNTKIRQTLRESVLTVCSYPQWGKRNRNSDLACAHIARGMAIAYDWVPDLWSEQDRALIHETIRVRMGVMLAGLYGKAYWARGYSENHNHVDIAALGLCGLAFLDKIPAAAEWLAAAQINFETVMRFTRADGSSPEGVPYWSYGLSFILQYIEGVRRILPEAGALYEAAYLRNATAFRLASSTSGFGGLMQWGDAINRDFYGPQHLLYRLASVYRDEGAQYMAKHVTIEPRGGKDVFVWQALWYDPAIKAAPPHELDHHMTDGDIVGTRSGWTEGDYLLAIKSGFTRRNHSHLDAGALALAFGNEWLVTTSGYGRGGGQKEFWQGVGPRWTFQSNATESHTTLLINGCNQKFDTGVRGTIRNFFSNADWCWTDIDLTSVYNDVQSVRRRVLHRRGDYILVFDNVNGVTVPAGAKADAKPLVEWLLQTSMAGELQKDDHHVVRVSGQTGGLDVRLLVPGNVLFAPYQPRSKHLDVAPDRLKSWTAQKTGADVEFVTLLEPRFKNAPSRIQAKVTRDEDGILIVNVTGRERDAASGKDQASKEWTDTIMLAPPPAPGADAPAVVRDFVLDDLPPARASGLLVRTTAANDGSTQRTITKLHEQR